MAEPPAAAGKPPSSAAVFGRTLATDRWVQLTYAAFAATAALYLLPVLSDGQRAFLSRAGGPFVFLSLAVAALAVGLGRLRAEERRFWTDVIAAFGAWLVVAALFLVFPQSERPPALDLLIEALYAAYYVALVLAAERQPHRVYRWRASGLERVLAWPAAVVFVLGLFAYFIVIPIVGDAEATDRWRSSYVLYLTLDAYLSVRFAVLAATAETRRWRILYAVLGVTSGTVFLNDLLEVSVYAGANVAWGATLDLAYYLPYLVIVLARARHFPFPGAAAAPAEDLSAIPFSGPPSRTLIYALAFPVTHFGCYATGLLDAGNKSQRETLVFVLLLLLGLIAVIQQRLFGRKTRQLWRDRKRVLESLRDNEQDLRVMVERYHSDQRLRISEEKFAKALAASPDVIAISSMSDGRIEDVNDSFVAVTGYARDELVGHTVAEIDLWADPRDRERMVRLLERQETVRKLEARFRTKSGGIVSGLLSAEKFTIDGEPYLLSVTHILGDHDWAPGQEDGTTRLELTTLDGPAP